MDLTDAIHQFSHRVEIALLVAAAVSIVWVAAYGFLSRGRGW